MRTGTGVCVAIAAVLAMTSRAADALPIEDAAKALSDRIVSTYEFGGESKTPKLAVLEFADLNGTVNNAGRLLAEEVLTELFASRKFAIVERLLLSRVLEEHKLAATGLVEPQALRQLGQLTGADAIVTGTLSDEPTSIRVSARVISTATGEILAAASVSIAKDEAYRAVSATGVTRTDADLTVKPSSALGEPKRPAAVLDEDFSNVQIGMLPQGWVSGNEVMVKKSGKIAGNVLTANADGSFQLFIPTPSFPREFRLEMKLLLHEAYGRCGFHAIVGNLAFDVGCGSVQARHASGTFENVNDKVTVLTFEKRGDVVKCVVNGAESLVLRAPDFKPPEGITLAWSNASGAFFSLYSIKVTQ